MLGLAFASRRRLHTVAPGRQLAALLCAPRPRRAVRRLAPNARGSFWMARCASGRPLDSPPRPQAARATPAPSTERACLRRPPEAFTNTPAVTVIGGELDGNLGRERNFPSRQSTPGER